MHVFNFFYISDKMDEEVVQDGVRIFIDKKAQLTLLGICVHPTMIYILKNCVF